MLVLNPLHWQDLSTNSWYVVNCLNIGHLRGQKRGDHLLTRSGCIFRLVLKQEASQPWAAAVKLTCSRPQTNGCHKEPEITLFRSDFPPWISADSRGSLLVKVAFDRCHSCGEKDKLCWELWNLHRICYPCIHHGMTVAPFPYGQGKDACCQSYGCGEDPVFLAEKEADETYELACRIYQSSRRC